MTTYDMKSASLRALTTLASSLSSESGSPLSPTAELDSPEERLAARMVQRFGLEPPIDVEAIAASRATVSTKRFPLEVDGLCLDLKVNGKRPKIWVAHHLHRVRRRFTLAHEIGHIIIPWHAGVIVDELDAPHRLQRGRYREMEAEANRFAAELLMPTIWVRRTIERSPHPTALMNVIVQVADVSYPAALYRVQKLSPPGFVGAEARNDIIVWSGATRGTQAKAPAVGSRIDQMDTLILEQPKALQQGESTYLWWKVRDELVAPPAPAEPWKAILEGILASVPGEHREITRSRINAVIGGSFARTPRGTPVDTLYTTALKACQNRNDRDRWLRAIFDHPDFLDYLNARCHAHATAR